MNATENLSNYPKNFPKQSDLLHCIVSVRPNGDERIFTGKVIRDDICPQGQSVIVLEDGPVLTGTECKFWIAMEGDEF